MSGVHPAIESDIGAIDLLIANCSDRSTKMNKVVVSGLVAQRDFLAARPQMVAFNTLGSVRSLMRAEGVEVLESLVDSLKKRQVVNGNTSLEGADWIIFASQYSALLQKERAIGRMGGVEVAVGLHLLKLMTRVFPKFDPVEPLGAKVKINMMNWPSRPLQAPHDWPKTQISEYHREIVRPAMKDLRSTMPGGQRIMHPRVAEALEQGRDTPPDIDGALPNYAVTYMRVITSILG